MAARFYAITKDEIHEFLTGLGFVPMALKGVAELVYAKIIQVGTHRLSLRCYTAVNPNGESREKGSDAIRLQLYHKVQTGGGEQIVPVGRHQKCLRVASWRDNLRKAIERIADPKHVRPCPACGNPMVIRQNKATGGEFWGCSMFRLTGCKGKPLNGTPLFPKDSEELPPWERGEVQDKGQL